MASDFLTFAEILGERDLDDIPRILSRSPYGSLACPLYFMSDLPLTSQNPELLALYLHIFERWLHLVIPIE